MQLSGLFEYFFEPLEPIKCLFFLFCRNLSGFFIVHHFVFHAVHLTLQAGDFFFVKGDLAQKVRINFVWISLDLLIIELGILENRFKTS